MSAVPLIKELNLPYNYPWFMERIDRSGKKGMGFYAYYLIVLLTDISNSVIIL